ncbi:hypothetical protein [Streptococcus equinus]|uniref:hypothetical protein n=1 Tax=Streptococcus equinus TaxID=1335 RepID=UPI0037CEE14A
MPTADVGLDNKGEAVAFTRKEFRTIMMNMQDLLHDFLSLEIVRKIDLKPFMIL